MTATKKTNKQLIRELIYCGHDPSRSELYLQTVREISTRLCVDFSTIMSTMTADSDLIQHVEYTPESMGYDK